MTTSDASYAKGAALTVSCTTRRATDRSPSNGSTTSKLVDPGRSLDFRALAEGQPLPTETGRAVPQLGRVSVTALTGPLSAPAQRPDTTMAMPHGCGNGKPAWVTATGPTGSLDSAGDAEHPLLSGAAGPRVYTVRVLVDGEQAAVLVTHGAGARYDQRRFFLGRLPSTGKVEVVGLDSLGFEVGRARVE